MQVKEVPIASISPGFQPRSKLANIHEMERSLHENGLINPIGVLENGTLLYGNTRLQAAKNIGWTKIEARIWPNDTTPQEVFRLAVIENTVRTQMNFAERADALLKGAEELGVPPAECGKLLGIDQSTVSKTLKAVDKLSDSQVKALLAKGVGGSLAYYIAKGETNEERQYLFEQVLSNKWSRKRLETYFTEKRTKTARVTFKSGNAHVTVTLPKDAEPKHVIDVLTAMAHIVKRHADLTLHTMSILIREQHA